MTDNRAENSEIEKLSSEVEELLRKLASLGMVRRNGEFYEITELGRRVSSDVLGDQHADKPLQ